MNIENNIFKRAHIDYNKLINYGFIKENNNYTYTKEFMNNSFKAIINIDNNSNISSKVIDLSTNEEYISINIDTLQGEFINKVRNLYKDILIDIKDNCFIKDYFITNQANRITNYIIDKYKDTPEFLWEKYPGFGIFRNKNNNKWYALIANIDKSKIDKNSTGEIEIINLKVNENIIDNLLKKKGFYKAYHMNKKNWITIILDNSINDKEIIEYLDNSYNIINE